MPGQQILCVAEKPAIAKAVAQHLAGGRLQIVSTSDFHDQYLIQIAINKR